MVFDAKRAKDVKRAKIKSCGHLDRAGRSAPVMIAPSARYRPR
jgi:hypothetical protein